MIKNQLNISDLIYSHIRGTISEKDSEILSQWRDSSPDNEKLFIRLCTKESFKVKSEIYKSFEAQNRFDAISKGIRKKKIRRLYAYSSVAAAILIPVLVVSILFNLPKEVDKPSVVVEQIIPGKPSAVLRTADGKIINLEERDFEIKDESGATIVNKGNNLVYSEGDTKAENEKESISMVNVPRGGEYNMILSDGTKVWLNSESTIKYPVKFIGDKRIVRVSGEVYFDVAHNKKKPFIVVAGDNKVEVLGTEFNVRAYTDETYVATTLVEGKVRTWSKNQKISVLKPSQQCMYNKATGKCSVKVVDIEQFTAWKNGLFVFNSQRLEDILNTISKWYDVEIFFETNDLRDIVFSGRLKRYENAEYLLNIFENMEDVRFRIKGKTIYVRKK